MAWINLNSFYSYGWQRWLSFVSLFCWSIINRIQSFFSSFSGQIHQHRHCRYMEKKMQRKQNKNQDRKHEDWHILDNVFFHICVLSLWVCLRHFFCLFVCIFTYFFLQCFFSEQKKTNVDSLFFFFSWWTCWWMEHFLLLNYFIHQMCPIT